MSIPTNNPKFVSMLIVLLSLFIFVFFTKGYYEILINTIDEGEQNSIIHTQKIAEQKLLDEISKKLKKLEGTKNNKIGKYLQSFNEDDIIKEIYGYSTTYSKEGRIKIVSLSMTEPTINELGFNESKITISATVANKKVMIDFLNFLIQDSKYKFFINSFRVPQTTSSSFVINIPLTIFYKEIKKKNTDNKEEKIDKK